MPLSFTQSKLIRNFSRVAPALCFNFLQFYGLNDADFQETIGNYDVVPVFGQHLPRLFPFFLLAIFTINFIRCSLYYYKVNIKGNIVTEDTVSLIDEEVAPKEA